MMEVKAMNKAILTEISELPENSKDLPPKFLQLYKEAILLALKEQNVLDESQYLQCLQVLSTA